ncbi:ArsR/SmtB family transcription factor [Agromyces sp. SYSU T00194]|uniref:ArsR/SmtB family transcription factor n=1 Tax=Agromyces chitinivorans TaxID=3158560 RepID=UPI0033976B50
MADIFDVVADSTRREILGVLRERAETAGDGVGELSVSDIVAALGLSQPTVSKHLKVLREAGLVLVREEGQHRYYHLVAEPLEAIEDWLYPFVSGEDAGRVAELAVETLRTEQRAFAEALGKAWAETAHQVTSTTQRASTAVKGATQKLKS